MSFLKDDGQPWPQEQRPSNLVAALRRDQLNTMRNKAERLKAAYEIERLTARVAEMESSPGELHFRGVLADNAQIAADNERLTRELDLARKTQSAQDNLDEWSKDQLVRYARALAQTCYTVQSQAYAEIERLRAQIRNGYCTECGSGPGECNFANQEQSKCCPDCQHGR